MMKELSMHILDIAQNSVTAGAKNIALTVVEDMAANVFSFEITDDGCGMSEEMLRKVRDPFTTTRTTRKVGLGIPLLEQTCLQCGGRLDLESVLGKGTRLKAAMELGNIDRPPMGDIVNSIFLLIYSHPEIDFKYKHIYTGIVYELNTCEIREIAGDIPLNDPEIAEWLKNNISEGLAEIRG
jgi:hypothetical protein